MDITGVLHILCTEIKTKLGSFEGNQHLYHLENRVEYTVMTRK